jgi:hypothetical protein
MKTLTMPAATGTQNENGGHFHIKLSISGIITGVEAPIPPDMINPVAPDWASCAAIQGPAIALNRFAQ